MPSPFHTPINNNEVRDLSIEQHFKQNRIIITAALGIIVAIVGAVASNLM